MEKRETITREEFDRRLDALNERRDREAAQRDEAQARVEQLLTQYERALNEIEAHLDAEPVSAPVSSPALLRVRLQELASKTAQLAASL